MIHFCRPSITDLERQYIAEATRGKLCGDGPFTERATALLCEKQGIGNALLTTSCSHALELAAMLCGVGPGDEVILPSYTFSSTANAFLLRGATLKFCDIDPKTMNMDLALAETLITEKTRVLCTMDYAGVSCDMTAANALARKHNLLIVEDAAQAVGSLYQGRPCGIDADFACYSFHETKNYVMGEGGAITFRNPADKTRAEIIREKGTDRSRFYRGEVDKYTWQAAGSSYLPADTLAAMLCGQLERFEEIRDDRLRIWDGYYAGLAPLAQTGALALPYIPDDVTHNAHMFYLILADGAQRDAMLNHLRACEVGAVFHYLPLHSAPLGRSMGYRAEDLPLTEDYAARLLRLPLFNGMTEAELAHVVQSVRGFFEA